MNQEGADVMETSKRAHEHAQGTCVGSRWRVLTSAGGSV